MRIVDGRILRNNKEIRMEEQDLLEGSRSINWRTNTEDDSLGWKVYNDQKEYYC
jgi:hypothetical protein